MMVVSSSSLRLGREGCADPLLGQLPGLFLSNSITPTFIRSKSSNLPDNGVNKVGFCRLDTLDGLFDGDGRVAVVGTKTEVCANHVDEVFGLEECIGAEPLNETIHARVGTPP